MNFGWGPQRVLLRSSPTPEDRPLIGFITPEAVFLLVAILATPGGPALDKRGEQFEAERRGVAILADPEGPALEANPSFDTRQ